MERGGRSRCASGYRRHPAQGLRDCRHSGGMRRTHQEYRDAGATHIMLEIWGDDRTGRSEALRRNGSSTFPQLDAATSSFGLQHTLSGVLAWIASCALAKEDFACTVLGTKSKWLTPSRLALIYVAASAAWVIGSSEAVDVGT